MKRRLLTLAITGAWLSAASAFAADAASPMMRLSFFGTMQNATFNDGTTRDFSEMRALFTLRSPAVERDGLEYAIDVRGSAYPSGSERSGRGTIYDAWVGRRLASGHLRVRAGQMWLNDLGGIGSLGGAMAEYQTSPRSVGTLRTGVFLGAEPKPFDIGYAAKVRKGGAWVALDGAGARRHVLGYVTVRNSSVTERSVLTTTNFLPVGRRAFFYQAAEYDLKGPGGLGKSGLNYIFVNGRVQPVPRLELLVTHHHGRSIDARTISNDLLDGRPVDQKTLDGYLYESTGGRVTVEVIRNFRVFGGYARDKNNFDDKASNRTTAGFWANDIAHSGIDLSVTDNHISRSSGAYNSWYASAGRTFGRALYLSVDYSTSLSVVRFFGADGIAVETRPRTRRYSVNGVWNATRKMSLIVTGENLKDDASDDKRVLFGWTWRM